MTVPFQPQRIVAAIAKHRVKCVLIGGLGAVLHGSPATTNDADLCPDRSPANLTRLATMLRSLKARVRTDGVEDGLPFDCSAEFFANVELINLVTNAGDVDIAFRPAGSNGYPELITRSVAFDIDGHSLQVASLDDIIRSKEVANRPKDRAVLPILLALREEISQRE
ncbi:hypothetical protein BH10ACT2_BH10ACT2_23840 [soil metagenome]